MIYKSADTIPAKIFFKINETGDLSILSSEEMPVEKLQEIWVNIQEEHDAISPNKGGKKVISLYSRIESISAKQTAIGLAVRALKIDAENKDRELIELIQSRGYKFHYINSPDKRKKKQYLKDLERIERENETESIRIKSLQDQLPKVDEGKEENSFDDTVLSYGAFTGLGFIDTNKITLTQYYALLKNGNEKMKSLKNG